MTVIHSARKIDTDGQVDDFWAVFDGERIAATGAGSGWRAFADAHTAVDAAGRWLSPGFIDLHCHGGGGWSFEDGPEAVLAALAVHRARGTTRSVISLVTNPLAHLRENLSLIADLTELDPLVLGSHLEGPFLAASRKGAHNEAFIRDPGVGMLDELLSASRSTLRQLTIAPELPGALEMIEIALESGVTVAVGHTEATYAEAARAFDIGARLLTHAFNGMPDIHHRQPGPVMAAFDDDRVVLELIVDNIHLDPSIARLAFETAPARIALITDAMAAAGAVDGTYQLGSLAVTVANGRAVLSGTSSLAGSTLTEDLALRNAVTVVGVEPRAAVEALTATPARVLGRDHELGRLAPGYLADAVLLDHDWRVQSVWANGQKL